MLVVAALLLVGQMPSDPGLLGQKVGEREYTFCLSFSYPFPESPGLISEGVISRRTKVFVSRTARLNAGAHVLVAGQRDGYAAIFDPRTGNEGCVVASALKLRQPVQANDRRLWIGNWEKIGFRTIPKDSIAIRPGRNGTLRIVGDARWKASAKDPDDSTNFGEINARASIRSGAVEIRDAEPAPCRYSLRLIGRALVVLDRDDEMCNGHNVTFSGVYRRLPGR